ncbi:MAG: hypothetical protein U0835_18730 [Isosphaeraceae bacterium]
MRPRILGVLAVAAGCVVGLLVLVRSRAVPLGVPGEWEWLRPQAGPEPFALGLAALAVVGYALFVAVGMRALASRAGRARETLWVLTLSLAAAGIQLAVQSGAPPGYGLGKWDFALHQKGSNGYFTVAKEEAADLPRFLAAYPTWIQKQDALHIGTHPPGLIASQAWLLHFMEVSGIDPLDRDIRARRRDRWRFAPTTATDGSDRPTAPRS